MGVKNRLKSAVARVTGRASVSINSRTFSIPIINNLGLDNIHAADNWFLRLLKAFKLPAGSSFVDIGVNVGQTLLVYRSYSDNPYWGFEPNPNCVFYLNVLKRNNSLKNVNIIPVGLSNTNDIVNLFSKTDIDSGATIVSELRPAYYDSEEINYVPLFKFDNLELNGLERVGFIKIDVEGGEYEVVSGMMDTINKHRPIIVCEVLDYHSEESRLTMQDRANKLVGLIKMAEYDSFRISGTGNELLVEPVETIQLKQWTAQSLNNNDYLFTPKEDSLLEKIHKGEISIALKK